MTIKEAIDLVDKLKPNQYPFTLKAKWLSKLDGMLFREVFMTHEGCPMEVFAGYDDAPSEQELLVPYPYDEDVYNYFLQAQIDKENGETGKYNQSITLYNTACFNFQSWYNRTHKPLSGGSRFRF